MEANKVIDLEVDSSTAPQSVTKKDIITKEITCPVQKISTFIGTNGSSVVREIYRKTGCMIYINQDIPEGATSYKIELSGLDQEVYIFRIKYRLFAL